MWGIVYILSPNPKHPRCRLDEITLTICGADCCRVSICAGSVFSDTGPTNKGWLIGKIPSVISIATISRTTVGIIDWVSCFAEGEWKWCVQLYRDVGQGYVVYSWSNTRISDSNLETRWGCIKRGRAWHSVTCDSNCVCYGDSVSSGLANGVCIDTERTS